MNVLLEDHGDFLSDTNNTPEGCFRTTATGKRRGPPLTPLETVPSPFSLCACPQSSEASYVPTPVASNRAKTSWVPNHKKRQIIPQDTIDHLHGWLEALTFGVLQPSAAWQSSQTAAAASTSAFQHDAPPLPPAERRPSSSKKLAVTLFPTTDAPRSGSAGFHNDCGVPTLAPPRCRDASVRRSVLGPTHRASNNRRASSSHHRRGRTRRIRPPADTSKRPSPPGVVRATPTASTPCAPSSSKAALSGMEVRTRPHQHRTHYGDDGPVKRSHAGRMMSPDATAGTGSPPPIIDPVDPPRTDPGTGRRA